MSKIGYLLTTGDVVYTGDPGQYAYLAGGGLVRRGTERDDHRNALGLIVDESRKDEDHVVAVQFADES